MRPCCVRLLRTILIHAPTRMAYTGSLPEHSRIRPTAVFEVGNAIPYHARMFPLTCSAIIPHGHCAVPPFEPKTTDTDLMLNICVEKAASSSNQKQSAAAAAKSSKQQQAADSSSKQQHATASSSKQQQAAASSGKQQQQAAEKPPLHTYYIYTHLHTFTHIYIHTHLHTCTHMCKCF